jgi:hypothetical protein
MKQTTKRHLDYYRALKLAKRKKISFERALKMVRAA